MFLPESAKSIVPLDDIRKQWGWDTNPANFLVQVLIHDYGLQLIEHSSRYPESIDCGNWVLGEGREHFYSFAGKGKWSKEFIYGALAQYGMYWIENPESSSSRSKFLTLDEKERLGTEDTENVLYQETHIGITTENGDVISKWGSSNSGHVIKHKPHIVPYGFGEVEFVKFSTLISDKTNQEQEVLIMPHYLFNEEKVNLELVLTDGVRQVGLIRGILKGELGEDMSSLVITEMNNMSDGNLPTLMQDIIPFLQQEAPAISGIIWFDLERVENEDLSSEFLNTYQL